MSTRKWVGIVVSAVLMATAAKTWGQRGMDDSEGVIRQAVETQRIAIEGTVKEVLIETCENTTGPFETGLYLLLTTGEDKTYNVHLGPAVIVKDMVEPLNAGQSVTVQAFRTEKMPAEHFVAVLLTFNGKTVRLRNESLRPVWAGRQGRFFGRYVAGPERPRWGPAYGRGYGMGNGRGYAWSNGMGYGQGRRGRGQGRGPGIGYGPRMCPWGAAPACPAYFGRRD